MFVKNLILSSYAMTVNTTTYSTYIAESLEWVTYSMDYYVSSTQLSDLVKNNATNWNVKTNGAGNGSVIIELKVRRTTGYYFTNLIIPLLVVELIGLFAVAVPGHCDEKPGLLLEIILAFCLYQLLLADAMPKTNSVPYLGTYIMVTMLLAAWHLFMSALVYRIVNYQVHELPPLFLRVICIRPVHFASNSFSRAAAALKRKLCQRRSPTVAPQSEDPTTVNAGTAEAPAAPEGGTSNTNDILQTKSQQVNNETCDCTLHFAHTVL